MKFKSGIVLLCLFLLASNVAFSMDEIPSNQQQSVDVSELASVAPTTETKKSSTVYITKNGEKYHRANCHYLKYSSIPIELDKAIELGYTPCSICLPPLPDAPLNYEQEVLPPTEKEEIVKASNRSQWLGRRYSRRK